MDGSNTGTVQILYTVLNNTVCTPRGRQELRDVLLLRYGKKSSAFMFYFYTGIVQSTEGTNIHAIFIYTVARVQYTEVKRCVYDEETLPVHFQILLRLLWYNKQNWCTRQGLTLP